MNTMNTTTKTETKLSKKQKLINASIRRLNNAYEKASPAGRRVLIAKDALKQIRQKRYDVRYGTFVEYSDAMNEQLPLEAIVQFQPYLHDPKAPSCQVCGIGSLFLSAVRCRNEFQTRRCASPNQNTLVLLTEFDERQRMLIEMAFEMGHGWYNYRFACDGGDKRFHATRTHKAAAYWASKFHHKNAERGHKQDEARLVALLKNIVRNKGRFNPHQR